MKVVNVKKAVKMILVCLLVAAIPANLVFADPGDGFADSMNNEGNPPDDPGVGPSQTVIRTESAMWVLPHGDTFFIGGQEVNVIEDWEMLEKSASEDHRGNGPVYFLTIDGVSDDFTGCEEGDCGSPCGSGGGLGECIPVTGNFGDDDCNGNGNGNGCNGNENGNGQGPARPDDCSGSWVIPGKISAFGKQLSPAHALVVGQDPAENGTNSYWSIQIEPTTLVYKDWQLIGHRHLACVEGDLDENGNGNIYDPGDSPCPHGWHEVIQHVWGWGEEQEMYPEGIGDLKAEATLQSASRGGIQGELAVAYPGAHLIHPNWSYSQIPACTWMGDVCFWDFTANIAAADPGWYDIKVTGTTAGTSVYTPRGFELVAGEFGVYMLDDTIR